MDAYSQGVQGSPFIPTEAGTDDGEPVTRVPPRPAFYFKAHRARWGIIDGQVLPILGKMALRAGVNGVTSSRGAFRTAKAKSDASERGWRIIPLDCVPPAHGVESYLYTPPGRPDVHLCYTDRCYPGDARIDTDEKMWTEFLAHLVESGAVDPCPPYVLARMLEETRKLLISAQKDARTVPSRQADAARIAEDVATLEAAASTKTAKPVRRRKAAVMEAD